MRSWFLGVLIAGALPGAVGKVSGDEPAMITWSEHVAPIVFEHCSRCHRPGEAAPFPLLSYKDVRKHSRTIVRAVSSRYMPPWQPEPGWGSFRDELRLTDDQVGLIKKWVQTGMPEGDPKKEPKAPEFAGGWLLGKPDLVVQMERPFTVPEDGPDIYRNFVLPLNLKENQWVKAVQMRTNASSVVHHVLYFLDDSGRARKLDGKEAQPGFPGMKFQPTGSLGGWAVGAMPRRLPEELAYPLAKGSDLVLQSHFHPTGKEEKCQMTVGLYFADKPPARTLVLIPSPPAFGLFSGIDIPAGKADYTIHDSFTLPADLDLVGAGAHAHYIGKSLKMTAELPDKTTKRIFFIRDWDFNWQGVYLFKDFVRLPKGTTLRTEIVWDNSANNPHNPKIPPVRVRWGEGSTDEMGSIRLLAVTADEKESPMLKKAVQGHVNEAVRAALRRGDKLPLEDFGIKINPKTGEPERLDPPPKSDKPLNFEDLDGKTRQPLEVNGAKANVLIFLVQDCPICNGYSPTISALVKDYADKPVRFYVVQTDPDLKAEAARKHAKEYGLPSPVIIDARHQLVKATGVTITPEVAVISDEGRVAYRGRIDDLYPGLGKKRVAPTRRDLREALDAVLAGKDVAVPRTEAVGCSISDVP